MITTGGTGGHVFPGLAVARSSIARGARVFWLGTREGMEATLVPQHGVDFESVSFRGVRGKGVAHARCSGRSRWSAACSRAARIIRRRRSGRRARLRRLRVVPGALMGVATGRPLVVHDANAVAGLANRVLAYGADRILLGFPDALRRHARDA